MNRISGKRQNSKLKFYEFFAGAGMARLGLRNWDCIWANDNDPRKVSIYKHNYGAQHIDSRDIVEVARDVESGKAGSSDHALEFPMGADMAWASFPCQDVSWAGWQEGMSGARSGTYWSFWKIMNTLHKKGEKPPVIVIENVKGLLFEDNFNMICESLAALDMKFGAVLIDAKHFVPQSRPRVFVIAVNSDTDLSGLTSHEESTSHWLPEVVKEAYWNLPDELKGHWVWWKIKPVTGVSPTLNKLFERDPMDVQCHDKKETRRLMSMMTPRNLKKIRDARNAGGRRVGFLYKRMRHGEQKAEVRFDGLAGCLRTPKGGSSCQTVVLVEGNQVQTRLLSRVEAARLMGIMVSRRGRLPDSDKGFFPENFSYRQSYMAVGDGVVVPVVEHLASSLLNRLARRAAASRSRKTAKGPGCGKPRRNSFLKPVLRYAESWNRYNTAVGK